MTTKPTRMVMVMMMMMMMMCIPQNETQAGVVREKKYYGVETQS